MNNTGKPHEGWMMLIPLSVLLFIVMVAFGGPDAFANAVMPFATQIVTYTVNWVRLSARSLGNLR